MMERSHISVCFNNDKQCDERLSSLRAVNPGSEQSGIDIVRRGTDALWQLLRAHDFAQELQRDDWDFAVEIELLQQAGLTKSDIRWLVCRGLVRHGREVSPEGSSSRVFRKSAGLRFHRTTCCILTGAGVSFVRECLANDHHHEASSILPHWDPDRQMLYLGNQIVKQYKAPAPNQETILAVFEEEGWPIRIDDPLSPGSILDPRRRLHDTINSLNRHQRNRLIRFEGDGSGQGVRWNIIRHALTQLGTEDHDSRRKNS